MGAEKGRQEHTVDRIIGACYDYYCRVVLYHMFLYLPTPFTYTLFEKHMNVQPNENGHRNFCNTVLSRLTLEEPPYRTFNNFLDLESAHQRILCFSKVSIS